MRRGDYRNATLRGGHGAEGRDGSATAFEGRKDEVSCPSLMPRLHLTLQPMSDFQELKIAILDVLHLSKDAVHLHLGILVFITVLLLLRGRRSPWLACTAVLVLALVLELLDLRDDRRSLGHFRWTASLHDLANTLLWPTVLTVLVHFGRLPPTRSARKP